MPKTIYRPQGQDPVGTTVGGRVLGVVIHGVPDDEAKYLVEKKGFYEVPATFNPVTDKLPGQGDAQKHPEKKTATKPDANTTNDGGAAAAAKE